MNISMVEVAGANFRTDKKSDEINTLLMERLGVRLRYLPARLAISRSLSEPKPLGAFAGNNDGKVIKGDTLFGTDTTLLVWISLIIEHFGNYDVDVKKTIDLVAGHWRRGIAMLDDDWDQSEGKFSQFVGRLLDVAELPRTDKNTSVDFGGKPNDENIPTSSIALPIGEISEDTKTSEKVLWDLNGVGGSPHSAIMGGVGSGKTRTAVAMLKSIREQTSVPLIAFDFKGDLGSDDNGNGYHIEQTFNADTLSPPRQPIPLNVFALNSKDDIGIAEAASRFRDAFAHLKVGQLGAKQGDAIHQAATDALTTHEVCELKHIQDALMNVYEDREYKEDGAISTMRELCRFSLFEPKLALSSFFANSHLIKLPPNIVEESRKLVVNLVLNALDQYLNSLPDALTNATGARGLRVLCMVDEAHQILGQKLPSLSNLMRMSRSKGGAIMLISQSPDDFSGVEDDFLAEMGLIAAFNTNASPRNVKRILGRDANLTTLKTGQCFVKRRDDQISKRILAWSNENRSNAE